MTRTTDHSINEPREDPVSVLEQEARAVAHCFGMAACDEVAAAFVDRILLRLGGAYVYVPQRRVATRQRAHREIASKFNGRNLKELAREYSLTPRHVRRIVTAAEKGASSPEAGHIQRK